MITATLLKHMGDDLDVANAARVSFGKSSAWKQDNKNDATYLSDRDVKLIRYLAKHKHISPFGHCFASFHVKAPVFVARQLVKHKFLRWNEISRRYIDDEPEFYKPDAWRGRSADKKQGSTGVVYPKQDDVDFANHTAMRTYKLLLEAGAAPEQARMVLPQSTMTEWWWSGSLDAFADMCNLRLKTDTQYETQLVAQQIDQIMLGLFPVSWEALVYGDD